MTTRIFHCAFRGLSSTGNRRARYAPDPDWLRGRGPCRLHTGAVPLHSGRRSEKRIRSLDKGPGDRRPIAVRHVPDSCREAQPEMTPLHWFALLFPFCACALFDFICTEWGKRIAWTVIILCLAYL